MGIKRRGSDRAGRAKMRSPGRPSVLHRAERRPFWQAIADGGSSEEAALSAGVSQPVGTRWFREAGGMPPSHLSSSAPPPSGRYLSFDEREQIALLRAKDLGVREIARELERNPSTISRELRRNAARRGGGFEYRAIVAQWHADRAALRPKPAKLTFNVALRIYVQDCLAGLVVAPSGAAVRGPVVPWNGGGTEGGSIDDGLGRGVQSRLRTAPPRLSQRHFHAHKPRGDLSSAIRAGAWCIAT